MVTKKSISQLLAVLLIVMFLLIGALPVRAETPASPPYASGAFLWAKSMGGTDSDFANGITVDSSNNIYTTGGFVGTADFDPNAGTTNLTSVGIEDIFVSKLDSSGNFVWAKSMGGIGEDVGIGIAVDSNGNVYLQAPLKALPTLTPVRIYST